MGQGRKEEEGGGEGRGETIKKEWTALKERRVRTQGGGGEGKGKRCFTVDMPPTIDVLFILFPMLLLSGSLSLFLSLVIDSIPPPPPPPLPLSLPLVGGCAQDGAKRSPCILLRGAPIGEGRACCPLPPVLRGCQKRLSCLPYPVQPGLHGRLLCLCVVGWLAMRHQREAHDVETDGREEEEDSFSFCLDQLTKEVGMRECPGDDGCVALLPVGT